MSSLLEDAKETIQQTEFQIGHYLHDYIQAATAEYGEIDGEEYIRVELGFQKVNLENRLRQLNIPVRDDPPILRRFQSGYYTEGTNIMELAVCIVELSYTNVPQSYAYTILCKLLNMCESGARIDDDVLIWKELHISADSDILEMIRPFRIMSFEIVATINIRNDIHQHFTVADSIPQRHAPNHEVVIILVASYGEIKRAVGPLRMYILENERNPQRMDRLQTVA